MKPIDEIYRPFPEEGREKPPPATPASTPGFPWPLVVLAALLAGMLSFVLLPSFAPYCNLRVAQEGTTEHLIDNLTQAAKSYEFDHDVYPPGDGNGSRGLARCLMQRDARGRPYFEFLSEMLDKDGNIINPVWASRGKVMHYLCPGRHFVGSFDLWAEDLKGDPQGLNNWE